jgi:putative DNA primase/helicase
VNLDELLTERGQPSEYTIAECFGRRLVSGAEWDSNKQLNAALVKLMTGGDTLSGRKRYGQPFTFTPQFKLVASTNALPRFDASDTGLLRRLTIVPFGHPVRPSDRDPRLKRIFIECPATRSAILNWALEGARSWFEQKRFPPAHQVDEAHRALKARSDPVGTFIESQLRFTPTAVVAVAELRDALREWEVAAGRPVPFRDLTRRLGELPDVSQFKSSAMHYRGIELVGACDE